MPIISILLVIFALFFRENPKHVLFLTSITFSFILIIFYFLAKIKDWFDSRQKLRVYENWNVAPKKYEVNDTLDYCGKTKAHLEIIARTCFRWLCGDEETFKVKIESFEEERSSLQDKIIETIKQGASIHFVLQNYNIPVPFFTPTETIALRQHAEASIKSYKEIRDRLRETQQRRRLRLSFVNKVIENSMVRIIENNKVTRFIFDLGIKFKSPESQKSTISKPFLVIESPKPTIDEINDLFGGEFKYILELSIPEERFEKEKQDHVNDINNLINEYKHYSKIRGDNSKALATVAADYYLAENDAGSEIKNTPPICIQLLVTNNCTTHCKMCDHYKLFKPGDELTDDELFLILDAINNLGTKCIVISGGEPLSRASLFKILEYAKKIGLNIGLLTNGVKDGGVALTQGEADILRNTCSWIQFSIDSFNENTYNMIRGYNYLNAALKSLNNLATSGYNKLEVCITIQKDNINEIVEICNNIDQHVPQFVPVRFKFAHGPENGRDFLFSESDLNSLTLSCPHRHGRFNLDYLISMIQDKYFDYEGLPKGTPIANKMNEFNELNYRCHTLRLSCKIDAKGDVYPCCFLFDDNFASSEIRNKYLLGSLRSRPINRVLPKPDLLKEIWYRSTKLDGFRKQKLPLDKNACQYCTRHFYQNEFLNKLYKKFEQGRQFGVAEIFASHDSDSRVFWI